MIHTLHSTARSKGMKSLAIVLPVCVMGCGVAAQERRTGSPSRSAPGAEVYFIDLKDGTILLATEKSCAAGEKAGGLQCRMLLEWEWR